MNENVRFDPRWLFEDKPAAPGVSPADYDGFEVSVNGEKIVSETDLLKAQYEDTGVYDLLVSRNGKLYPAKKLESAPENAASETVFDIFCDRLYPHAVDAEQAARISKQGL